MTTKISRNFAEITGFIYGNGYTANKAELPTVTICPIRFNGTNYATPFKYLEICSTKNSDQQVLDFNLRGVNDDAYFEDENNKSPFFDFTTITIPYSALSELFGLSNEEIEQTGIKLNNYSVSEQYEDYILIDLSDDHIFSKTYKKYIVIEEILANILKDSFGK